MQRRPVLAGLAALPAIAAIPAFAAMPAADTLETSAGAVAIMPVKHASLALGFGDQVLYVDPARADFSALPAASAILITHGHGDHFDPEVLAKVVGAGVPILTSEEVFGKLTPELQAQAAIIRNGESGEIVGVPVDAVTAHNITTERMQYHPVGVGNGYVLTFGDKRIYVAGDTEPTPEMLALSGIDVAFLPMNLPFTMTVEQAAEAVKTFAPKAVYPYHYGESDTASFAQMVGDASDVRLRDWYAA